MSKALVIFLTVVVARMILASASSVNGLEESMRGLGQDSPI